jgi:hypothetical protein
MLRRDFIATGLAAFGACLATGTARAQTGRSMTNADLPAYLQPALVQMRVPLPAGEVHVFPNHFQLFWTMPDGMAWRYGIRVGRDRLYEPGSYFVGAKKEWPSWTPTANMIEREPEHYKQYEDGMPGGPDNPLGARALYLFRPRTGDTFLRIHGTNETWTIGRAASNGCAGLTNEQITLLYPQVPLQSRVVLYPKMVVQPGSATGEFVGG